MPSFLRRARIAGTGAHAPDRVVTNADLAQKVDTSDEWIRSRTGIEERRIAQGEAASDIGALAASKALEAAGVSPGEVDAILVATATPDYIFPSTAAMIQKRLGCSRAFGFDLSAACSGFVYALSMASNLIAVGQCETVLVVGTEVLSTIVNFEDRNTCILFGDGAGACVLRPVADGQESGILGCHLRLEGNDSCLVVPAGGSRLPASEETVRAKKHAIFMDGKETFRFAVTSFKDLYDRALAEHGWTAETLDWIVPHQVNIRILEAASRRCDFPMERIAVNLQRFGNTSSAGIPMCLDELARSGRLKTGDRLLLVAFGAGLTWGSAALRW